MTSFLTAAAAGLFLTYPNTEVATAKIEAVADRGPIAELTIACPRGTGIISFAKGERVYCLPSGRCTPSLAIAIRRLCK
ncbi:MAG: hypothetical protein AAFO62_06060 [Pseudomonadota bacterium]